MTTRSYADLNCPIAQALRVIGDQWTLLIVRDVLSGPRRFEELRAALGISRNLLTRRLHQLIDQGLLERRPVPDSRRFEYAATPTCRDLRIAVLALAEWGERWRPDPDGPRVVMRDQSDGASVGVRLCRLEDGTAVDTGAVEVLRGAAARQA